MPLLKAICSKIFSKIIFKNFYFLAAICIFFSNINFTYSNESTEEISIKQIQLNAWQEAQLAFIQARKNFENDINKQHSQAINKYPNDFLKQKELIATTIRESRYDFEYSEDINVTTIAVGSLWLYKATHKPTSMVFYFMPMENLEFGKQKDATRSKAKSLSYLYKMINNEQVDGEANQSIKSYGNHVALIFVKSQTLDSLEDAEKAVSKIQSFVSPDKKTEKKLFKQTERKAIWHKPTAKTMTVGSGVALTQSIVASLAYNIGATKGQTDLGFYGSIISPEFTSNLTSPTNLSVFAYSMFFGLTFGGFFAETFPRWRSMNHGGYFLQFLRNTSTSIPWAYGMRFIQKGIEKNKTDDFLGFVKAGKEYMLWGDYAVNFQDFLVQIGSNPIDYFMEVGVMIHGVLISASIILNNMIKTDLFKITISRKNAGITNHELEFLGKNLGLSRFWFEQTLSYIFIPFAINTTVALGLMPKSYLLMAGLIPLLKFINMKYHNNSSKRFLKKADSLKNASTPNEIQELESAKANYRYFNETSKNVERSWNTTFGAPFFTANFILKSILYSTKKKFLGFLNQAPSEKSSQKITEVKKKWQYTWQPLKEYIQKFFPSSKKNKMSQTEQIIETKDLIRVDARKNYNQLRLPFQTNLNLGICQSLLHIR